MDASCLPYLFQENTGLHSLKINGWPVFDPHEVEFGLLDNIKPWL